MAWVQDVSNSGNRYKRNFLRNKIILSLNENFTHVVENISRSANNNAQSLDLLHHLINFKSKSLTVTKLKGLPQSLQSTLLYHWLSHKNLPTPGKAVLTQITHDFIHANVDKHPHYQNRYYQLNRWQDAVYCIQNFDVLDSEQSYQWNTQSTFSLPNGCETLTYKGNESLDLAVKFNQTGQKLQNHKHQFSKTIKQLFQENKVPTWQRQNKPFIYHNDELASLCYDWSHNSSLKDLIEFDIMVNIF